MTKEWELVLPKYKPNKIIGQGASGIVVRAKDNNSNTVAIKYIKCGIELRQHYYIKKVLREI